MIAMMIELIKGVAAGIVEDNENVYTGCDDRCMARLTFENLYTGCDERCMARLTVVSS